MCSSDLRRRQTLLAGNLLRAGLIVATALVMQTAGVGIGVYALVLVALGVNRFLLSVLSAGLPRIIDRERLLVANSIVPTLGGAATALGMVIGILLRLLLPDGAARNTASLLTAAGRKTVWATCTPKKSLRTSRSRRIQRTLPNTKKWRRNSIWYALW